MIRFVLNKKDLPKRNHPIGLNVTEASDEYIIMQCINLFNRDLEWDGMFDVFDALRRIEDGQKMFVGWINGKIFGYCWMETIFEDEYYIYNVFSEKTNEPRTYGATDMLYDVIKNNTKGKIKAKVDDWNTKSIRVFEKLGFMTY